ncbi:MAG: hypothetical protein U0165_16015 [Polyangiaceae bacterium]
MTRHTAAVALVFSALLAPLGGCLIDGGLSKGPEVEDNAGASGQAGSAGGGGASGTGGTSGGSGTGGTGGVAGNGGTAGISGSGGTGGTSSVSEPRMRIAQLIPDATPARLCVRSTGTGDFSEVSVPGSSSISANSVTPYIEMAAGTYDLRLVTKDQTDCTGTPLVVWTAQNLGNETATTFVATGTVDGSDGYLLKASRLQDQTAAPASGSTVRAVNAALTNPQDLRLTTYAGYSDAAPSATGFRTLFPRIKSSNLIADVDSSSDPPIDALGYANNAWTQEPISIEVRLADFDGSDDTEIVAEPSLSMTGKAASLFVVASTEASSGFAAIKCIDGSTDQSEVGKCVTQPILVNNEIPAVAGLLPAPHAVVRVENLTSSPAKDHLVICVRPQTGQWLPGLDQAAATSLDYAHELEIQKTPGPILVRHLSSGSTSCDTPGAEILVPLEAGTSFSIPLIGIDDGEGLTPVLLNRDTAGLNGQSWVRVVNALVGQSTFDLQAANTSSSLISGVPYGGVSPNVSDGYASITPPTNLGLNTDVDASADYLATPAVTLNASSSYTVWVVGRLSDQQGYPVSMLVCETSSGLSSCTLHGTVMTPLAIPVSPEISTRVAERGTLRCKRR